MSVPAVCGATWRAAAGAFGTDRCAWLAIKERESAEIGPIKVATERRGFIPPVAGMAAVALGIVLVVADRRRRRT